MRTTTPTPPVLAALSQLNLKYRLYRATVRGIARIGHVAGSFAEANQLVVRQGLDSLPKIFDGRSSFADHRFFQSVQNDATVAGANPA
jgi:hypothetical protein